MTLQQHHVKVNWCSAGVRIVSDTSPSYGRGTIRKTVPERIDTDRREIPV